MWADLDDGDPDLTKHTEGMTSACMNFRFPEYIDHIFTGPRATALVRPGSFEQVLLTTVDPRGQARLSDHCPIAVVFETDGEIETSETITVLLDRLDPVQAELEEIRASPRCGSSAPGATASGGRYNVMEANATAEGANDPADLQATAMGAY